MSRSLFTLLLLVASAALAVPGVRSPVKLRVVNPQRWDGRCPHEFRFIDEITSRGAGDVQYTWDRSDGAASPIETLHFNRANQTATVRTTWRLASDHSGWEQIRVIRPNFIRSNKAGFALRCR